MLLVVDSRGPNQSFCRAAAARNARFFPSPTKNIASLFLASVETLPHIFDPLLL